MFARLIATSEALAAARPSLLPALEGCPDCGIVAQIAAPRPGTCPDCGSTLRPRPPAPGRW
jgi:hypothetical protein